MATKAELIQELKDRANRLASLSKCPRMYRLPSESSLKSTTKEVIYRMLDSIGTSERLRERVDGVRNVEFVDSLIGIRLASEEYPIYIGRDGIIRENIGIGYVQRGLASDYDLSKYPVLI